MTNLAGETMAAAKQLAINDNAAADAALNDQKKYHARRRAAHAIGCADGESVGVVLRHHRDSGWQNGPHPFGRIDVAPTEQRRHTDDAVAAHLRRR